MRLISDIWPLWAATFLFLFLLIISFVIGVIKKKKEERKQILKDWEKIYSNLTEKGFSEKEVKFLEELINKYEPKNPLRGITSRQHFNRCLKKYITDIRKKLSFEELDEIGKTLKDIIVRLEHEYVPYGQRIYSTLELYPNQPVWIYPKDKSSAMGRKGTVVDINGAFFRVAPFTERDRLPVSLGDYFLFKIWREEDGRYQFLAKLRKVELEPETYIFDHAFSLERFQSREYFRVRLDKPIEVDIIKIEGKYDLNQIDIEEVPYNIQISIRARIINLSAGGIALLMGKDINETFLLRLLFSPEDEKKPECIPLYVRIVSKENVSGGRYIYRGAFVGITDVNRDRVAKYVFRQQAPISKALREQEKKQNEEEQI